MANKKGNIITIVILILIVLGLGGYIVYDKIINKPEEKNEKLTIINDVEINLNALYNVRDKMQILNYTFDNPQSPYFGALNNIKKLETSKMDMGLALYLSLLPEMKVNTTLIYVPEEIVKDNFKKLFNDQLSYNVSTIKANNFYSFDYNQTTGLYAYYTNLSFDRNLAKYISLNEKTEIKSDEIIVTQKKVFIEYINISPKSLANSINLYYDNSKAKNIGKLTLKNGIISEKELLSKFGSKMKTYQYTFKEKNETEYYLQKIETIK